MESLSHIITPLLTDKFAETAENKTLFVTAVEQIVEFLKQRFNHFLCALSLSSMTDVLLTAPAWCASSTIEAGLRDKLKRMSLLF